MLADTNALLLPVRARFPLEAEVDRLRPGAHIAVPSSVLEELRRLIARKVRGASAALALAERYPSVPTASRGDTAILEAALARRAAVITADRALAARLRQAGVDVLVPRDRHRLEPRPGLAPPERPTPRGTRREPARRRQRL